MEAKHLCGVSRDSHFCYLNLETLYNLNVLSIFGSIVTLIVNEINNDDNHRTGEGSIG